MITYPITFHGKASAPEGMAASWEACASATALPCSIPKEFEGNGDFASPEDYFLMAVMNCFVATFKVYAFYSKFSFKALDISATLVVDKNSENKPGMQKVDLLVQLSGVTKPERARALVDKTMANGFILQSLKTELAATVTLSE